MAHDLTLRPATSGDLAEIAELYQRVRAAAVPEMPAIVHTPDEVVAHVTHWDLEAREVWVAETGRLAGFMTLTRTWLDSLYVDPDAQGQGIGSALLEIATSTRPGGFALWVFESNEPARAFYRGHGFVELERTDGSGNEEQAPDVRMAWPGEDPVEFLRAQIDEVDHDLAQGLARRSALTAAVQAHKPVGGQAGRDHARERQIAERMAVHAPALGVDRLDRIVHAIITESLDAAEGQA
ncbi:MAG: GNAT family N-acetyltransferase [Nocardioides sp.]|nr:GNAT family N-acetyltransferase [Nocardioides sp.]